LIQNLGAANSQWTDFLIFATFNAVSGQGGLTTGEGIAGTLSTTASWDIHGGIASAVDTTAAQALVLTVTLATANALEDMTLKFATVEVV
jgi:hypothetical protein